MELASVIWGMFKIQQEIVFWTHVFQLFVLTLIPAASTVSACAPPDMSNKETDVSNCHQMLATRQIVHQLEGSAIKQPAIVIVMSTLKYHQLLGTVTTLGKILANLCHVLPTVIVTKAYVIVVQAIWNKWVNVCLLVWEVVLSTEDLLML